MEKLPTRVDCSCMAIDDGIVMHTYLAFWFSMRYTSNISTTQDAFKPYSNVAMTIVQK